MTFRHAIKVVILSFLGAGNGFSQGSPDISIGYPFIFDDFDYIHAADYDTGDRKGSDGSILGENPWWIANANGALYLSGPTRFWYAESWLEGNNDFLTYSENYAHGGDSGWFDGKGYELYTSSPGQPSRLYLEAMSGIYSAFRPNRSPKVSSGHVAREGTWIARLKLSDFWDVAWIYSNTHHIQQFPSFWTQSTFFATEDRECYHFVDHLDKAWFETNFEINNWWSREDDRSIHGGITWASYFSNLRQNNSGGCSSPSTSLGSSGLEGQCWTDRGRMDNTKMCFDTIANSDRYVYMMIRVDNSQNTTELKLVVREENNAGQVISNSGYRPKSIEMGFELYNYIDPHPMRSLISLNTRSDGSSSARLDSDKTLEVDWFMYTPRTNINMYQIMGDANLIRSRLDQFYSGSSQDRVYRVNTTGDRVSAPTEVVQDSCTCRPTRPSSNFDFDVEIYETFSTFYILATPVIDNTNDYRMGTFNVIWDIDERIGGYIYYDIYDGEGEGWVYELDKSDISPQAEIVNVSMSVEQVEGGVPCSPKGPHTRGVNVQFDPQSGDIVSHVMVEPSGEGISLSILGAYPNPATGKVAVELTGVEGDYVNVVMLNVLGRIVMTGQYPGDENRVELNVSDLPAGVYLIEAVDGQQRANVLVTLVE